MTKQKIQIVEIIPRIKAFDFFCGAGGLTRGLLNAKIDVLAGIDNDPKLTETYERNNTPSKFVREDINTIDIKLLRERFLVSETDLVLYSACAPCQPFSTLNRMGGRDDRKFLLHVFAEKVLKVSPPDFLIVENVPGLGNAYGHEIHQRFVEILQDCGFDTHALFQQKLDAKDYGVPQVRKRFILLANRHGSIVPPIKESKTYTVATAIKSFPSLMDGQDAEYFPNHRAKELLPNHKRIVQAVPKDGGSRRDIIDTSILLNCHQRKPNVHKDVFGRMAWNLPAPTLTCRCTDVYCGRFTHPQYDRAITLREAAAIQTFENDYIFYGTDAHIAKQIGNAVPVELARKVGQSIIDSARQSLI